MSLVEQRSKDGNVLLAQSSRWVGSPVLKLTEQYFQYKETAQSVAEKSFMGLSPLTPGSESLDTSPVLSKTQG